MARSVSVKVATSKVIKALEDKIANNANVEADNQKKREAFKVAREKYFKTVLKDFKDSMTIDSISQSRWNNSFSVTYELANGVKLPEEPQIEPLENELSQYEMREIENAIRILKMTDEETVNASTFNKLAQYL